MRILCVGPASATRDYLVKALTESSYSITTADNERDGAYMSFTDSFDIVVLMGRDATPRLAGLFRSNARNEMIIGVADWIDADARAAILTAGADACFPMRFSISELIAKMHAFMRVGDAQRVVGEHDALRDVSSRLDARRRSLVCGERGEHQMPLSHGEFLLLECLMRQPGAIVPYAELLDYAYPHSDADRKTLTYTISRLRARLAQFADPATIDAISRIGYRMTFDRNSDRLKSTSCEGDVSA
jgi:DNA-binding response OmpR family regulator